MKPEEFSYVLDSLKRSKRKLTDIIPTDKVRNLVLMRPMTVVKHSQDHHVLIPELKYLITLCLRNVVHAPYRILKCHQQYGDIQDLEP